MPDAKEIQDDASLAMASGDWLGAANLYVTLEMMEPSAGTWSLKLGQCLLRAGKEEGALAALTRAAQAYVQQNQPEQAAAVCKQILEIDPKNAEVSGLARQLSAASQDSAASRRPLPSHLFEPPLADPKTSSSFSYGLRDIVSLAEDPLARESSPGSSFVYEPAGLPREAAPEPQRSVPRVVLPVTPFFQSLDEHQIRLVNTRARLRNVNPGEIVYAAGETSHALYIVASGELSMLVPQEVARLRRGDSFGEEVVVLPRQARMATIRAAEPSLVLELGSDLVQELIGSAPALLEVLFNSLRDCLVARLARTSPVLASLPEPDRLVMLGRFRCEVVEKDGWIYDTDARNTALFILLAGDAEATFENRLTEQLHPGDAFGEIALVTESPIPIRVMARERCLVLCLPQADFESARRTWPQVAEYLAALAVQRLARLQHAVLEDAPVFMSVPLPPRILVMHGEAEFRSSYEQALGEAGFLVDAAGDAATAAENLTSRRYDVVLCNLESFGETGSETLRKLRMRDLDVPIILTTRDGGFDVPRATASYGVVRTLVEPLNLEDLVYRARRAEHFHRLTRVRREAMTRLGSSTEWMGDRTSLELHFEKALGCLWMAFQPIVSAVDHCVFAYEALLRSGEELLHSPLAVLRAAERLDRVHDVGRIARESIAATLRVVNEPIVLFVNVHCQDLLDPHLLDPGSLFASFARNIVLEISERTPVDEMHDLGARIADLRGLGFRFALDNLGTGHAGIGSLAQLEPEVCKLDASLVRGVDRDSVKEDLVRAMLAVCRDMNILTICQGVETLPELHALMRLGADLVQGYLFGKPSPPFASVDFSGIGLPAVPP